MKALIHSSIASLLAFCSLVGYAAMEDAVDSTPAPTVDVVWVVVFLAVFVGVCAWIGIGIIRADRASKSGAAKDA